MPNYFFCHPFTDAVFCSRSITDKCPFMQRKL
uniref:Uncharacterized protein n=1 Tax=Anguilla anguilla TaxID=7936 RepID=A0A0E9XJY8_ANGAN